MLLTIAAMFSSHIHCLPAVSICNNLIIHLYSYVMVHEVRLPYGVDSTGPLHIWLQQLASYTHLVK